MKKSISSKAGFIVSISLSVTLIVMIGVMLTLDTRSRMKSADEDVHNLSHLITKSVTFSMSQGATDVKPFIQSLSGLKNLADLAIKPTDKIRPGSEQTMDGAELSVLHSGTTYSAKSQFNDEPVYRVIEPITSNSTCVTCHGGNNGDVLAVVSVRYSLGEMQSGIDAQQLTGIISAVVALIVTFLISMYFIKRKIVADLDTSIHDIERLAEGDATEATVLHRDDEIGLLNTSLKKLQECLTQRADLGTRFSKGDFQENVVLLSDRDVLGKAFQRIKESLESLVSDARTLSSAAVQGKLSERSDADKHSGEFRDVMVNFNNTLDAIVRPIDESSKVLGNIAGGNLTVRMVGDYRGDYAIVKQSINSLADSFGRAISDVSSAVKSTSNAAGEISSSVEQMAAGSQEQSAQATEVAGAVEQMTKTIHETTRHAGSAAQAAKSAGVVANESAEVIKSTIAGMDRIAEVVKASSNKITTLGKSSDQIGEIVQVIDDIADQTNLLALNAAIEAARAGEQGRGFAVVADEVRRLAERTTTATKEIAVMIKKIQQETGDVVSSISRGTVEVEKGRESAAKAGEALQEIVRGSAQVVDIISQVAAASEEQSSAAEQISKNIDGISKVTQESAQGAQQIAKSADNLNRLTAELQTLVATFKVEDNLSSPKGSGIIREPKGDLSIRSNGKIVRAQDRDNGGHAS